MEQQKKIGDVGVIVGRFQVPYLHEAHKDLIQSVLDEHERVLIFLGLSPVKVTIRNPLDFEARKQMILDEYPENVTVMYVKDMKDDAVWSKQLDEKINDLIGPTQKPLLYGSRDSFINHYSGKFETVELIPERIISGSDLRKKVSRKVKSSSEFREGVIWASSNQFPKTWPTIDAAILDEKSQRILLGRKQHEKEYRFIGGFVDPTDESLEATVRREVKEEAGDISLSSIDYVSSRLISDWRYKAEVDSIMTTFFACHVMFGHPNPGDDIYEVRWFNLQRFYGNESAMHDLVEGHRILMKDLIEYLINKKGIQFVG